VHGWNRNTIIPIFDHASNASNANNLQELFLVFTNFMFNIASYHKNNSSMDFTARLHCVIQCMFRKMAIALVEICFRNKQNIYILTENDSYNFLRMCSQPVGMSSCYFKFPDHYVVLMMSVVRLFNIMPIISINSFIMMKFLSKGCDKLFRASRCHFFVCSLVVLSSNWLSSFSSCE